MGIGNYNDEIIHDQNRTNFLPIFCRLSLKDVKINTVPISAASADPTSPRVSCMGQVKRSNRVTAAPTATAATHHHHKLHTKPRKIQYLISTKTLLPTPATTAASAAGGRKSGSRSCRSNRDHQMSARDSRRRSSVRKSSCDQDFVRVATVDISKMDPPLPVVKRAAPSPGNFSGEVNLWKRRSNNGVRSMQIEPINLPSKKFPPPPTTV